VGGYSATIEKLYPQILHFADKVNIFSSSFNFFPFLFPPFFNTFQQQINYQASKSHRVVSQWGQTSPTTTQQRNIIASLSSLLGEENCQPPSATSTTTTNHYRQALLQTRKKDSIFYELFDCR